MFWTFVEASEVAGGRVAIGGPQGHHLARVLRVRPGERGVAVSNGREYEIEVVEVVGNRVVGRVVGDRPVQGEPAISITLLQAVVPNPDFDAVIEAGTAGQDARIDAGAIHHGNVCGQVGEQRVEQIVRIAPLIQLDRHGFGITLEQFDWRVVLLKIYDHAVGAPVSDLLPLSIVGALARRRLHLGCLAGAGDDKRED